jgi:hypothetical protein
VAITINAGSAMRSRRRMPRALLLEVFIRCSHSVTMNSIECDPPEKTSVRGPTVFVGAHAYIARDAFTSKSFVGRLPEPFDARGERGR